MIREVAQFEPVFIGGAGRSGTTLLRSMLGCHSQLVGTNEFKFTPRLMDVYGDLLRATEIRSAFLLTEEYVDNVFGLLVVSLFTPLLQASGKQRVVEKTPHNVLVIDRLVRLFPRAKFIHVIRDGRDVAASLLNMNWSGPDGSPLPYTKSVAEAARYWVSVVTTARRHATLPQLRGRYLEVRYEELIEDTATVMKELLHWLNVPWESSVLDTTERRKRAQAEVPESSTAQVQEAIYGRARGRWRTELSPSDRVDFERIAGFLLRDLSYAEDSAWVDEATECCR